MSPNFSGQDLRGHSFAERDLTGADFSYADLRGADFSNATLVGANFSHARIGLLPFGPWRELAFPFSALGSTGFMLGFLPFTIWSHLLNLNTQFLKAYLVVPGVTLFAVLSVWFVVKSRQIYRWQIALAAETLAVAGGSVIIGTAIFAGEALVAAVSAGVTWSFLGAWISILTLDLSTKKQKALRWLPWSLFAIVLPSTFLLFTNNRILQLFGLILGQISIMLLMGYLAVSMGVLVALSLALASDRSPTFGWRWNLGMVWMVGCSLFSLWVEAGFLKSTIYLGISIAVIIAFIVAIAVLGFAIARKVQTGERPFPKMLSLIRVAQGTTNFAGANLTNAILTRTNAANTNWKKAILRNAHFEDEVSLENSPQLADILDEHPDMPKLIKQKQSMVWSVRLSWVLLLILVGYLGFIAFMSYSRGTWLSPKEVINGLRISTYLERVLDGSSGWISALAISPDNKQLVSGHNNGTIEVQDIKTGRSRYILMGHSGSVETIVIRADGLFASTSIYDRLVKLWDLRTGEIIRTFDEDGTRLSFISANGQTLATRHKDDIIKLRELPRGQLLHTLSVNQRTGGFILSPDGKLLIYLNDGTAEVWDLKKGQLLHTLTGNSFIDIIISGKILISPDGQTLISVYPDMEKFLGELSQGSSIVQLWDLTTGRLKQTRRVPGWIDALAISPDGQNLVGGDRYDDIIKVWELHTGKLLYVLPKLLNSVDTIAISPDGQFLAAASSNFEGKAKIAIWRLVKSSL